MMVGALDDDGGRNDGFRRRVTGMTAARLPFAVCRRKMAQLPTARRRYPATECRRRRASAQHKTTTHSDFEVNRSWSWQKRKALWMEYA